MENTQSIKQVSKVAKVLTTSALLASLAVPVVASNTVSAAETEPFDRNVKIINLDVEDRAEAVEQDQEAKSKDGVESDAPEDIVGEAPTFKLVEDKDDGILKLNVGSEWNWWNGLAIIDKEDGDLVQNGKGDVKVHDNELDMYTPGQYTVTYSVVDSDNNKLEFERLIQVGADEDQPGAKSDKDKKKGEIKIDLDNNNQLSGAIANKVSSENKQSLTNKDGETSEQTQKSETKSEKTITEGDGEQTSDESEDNEPTDIEETDENAVENEDDDTSDDNGAGTEPEPSDEDENADENSDGDADENSDEEKSDEEKSSNTKESKDNFIVNAGNSYTNDDGKTYETNASVDLSESTSETSTDNTDDNSDENADEPVEDENSDENVEENTDEPVEDENSDENTDEPVEDEKSDENTDEPVEDENTDENADDNSDENADEPVEDENTDDNSGEQTDVDTDNTDDNSGEQTDVGTDNTDENVTPVVENDNSGGQGEATYDTSDVSKADKQATPISKNAPTDAQALPDTGVETQQTGIIAAIATAIMGAGAALFGIKRRKENSN